MSRGACPPCVFVPHPSGRGPVVTLRCPRAQRDQRGIADSHTVDSCGTSKLATVKELHETLHAEGTKRLSTTVKIGTRTDKEASLEDKLFEPESR